MLRKILFSALMLGTFAALPALAETEAPVQDGPKKEFKNPADTDGDGFLSKAEFMAVQEKRFAEMDKDSDGKVSREENKAFRDAKRAEFKEKRAEWKEKHDAQKQGGDHDGEPEGAPNE